MTNGTLVLAAGQSTRIAAISKGLPKPLLPIAGQPLIGWNFRWLAGQGVRDVWVNLHYRADTVRETLGDGSAWGVNIHYAPEDDILGTAGAWRQLGEQWGQTSLVVYGDNLVRFELEGLRESHRRSGAAATMALFDPDRHLHTGIAGGRAAVAADGRVDRFVEGGALPLGTRGFVNAGVYLLDRSLLDRLRPGYGDFARDLFPGLAAEGGLHGHLIEDRGFCLGLDTPESFAVADDLIRTERIVLS
jgi:NDP-sugar pyrophosphorylase family protein